MMTFITKRCLCRVAHSRIILSRRNDVPSLESLAGQIGRSRRSGRVIGFLAACVGGRRRHSVKTRTLFPGTSARWRVEMCSSSTGARLSTARVYPSISAYNFRVPHGPQDSKSRQNPLCGFRCAYTRERSERAHWRLRIYTTADMHVYIYIYI